MNNAISVRSNCYFAIGETGIFEVEPALELIIIHTDGKDYAVKKGSIISSVKFAESRFLISPEGLSQLITEMQLHQQKLQAIRANADQINSLIRVIAEEKKQGNDL